MKNFKGLLIALGLLVSLGTYIFFFEKGPAKNADADQGEKILKKAVADVQGLELEYPSEPTEKELVAKIDDHGTWALTMPDALPADEGAIRNFLSSVADCRVLTELKDPKSLADYGLDKPGAKGTLRFKDGSVFRVTVGDKNVNGTASYILVEGRKSVFLVPNDMTDWFKRKTKDFRNRKILAVSELEALKVRLTHGSTRITLEKGKDGKWNMTEPLQVPASSESLRQILSIADGMQATEFPDDHPTSLAKYGLNHPQAVLEVWKSEKDPAKVLAVGSERKSDKKVYVQNRSEPYVYLVNPESVKAFESKMPGDFRPKDFMQFSADLVTQLVLKKGTRVLTYTKDSNGSWYSKDRPSASSEVPGVLAPLATTLVLEYGARGPATGLSQPVLAAEVTLADGTTRVYRYGKRVGEDKVYLASDKGPDALVVASYILTQMESIFTAPTKSAAPQKK
jgi:hypothetical protein